jgi:hypothetical protein
VRETRHYLGLELAGAKNQKTALAALEYYPKEKKIFLLDIFDRIAAQNPDDLEESEGRDKNASAPSRPASSSHSPSHTSGPYAVTSAGDQALLELIHELTDESSQNSKVPNTTLGVNVPLQLPPCLEQFTTAATCTSRGLKRKSTGGVSTKSAAHATAAAAVKWMNEATRKAERQFKEDDSLPRVLEFTPYTQRPVELWVRYQVFPKLPPTHRFEIDETLGGTKAPLTARMNFLQRHLDGLSLVEVWPKLTVAVLALDLELPKRVVQSYRRLEEGVHAREQILETLSSRHDIFIYERDIRKLSNSLPAFDAFMCAYTALLSDIKRCATAPAGFPVASGWVQYPQC